ncbi:MAG: hypothetical protein J6S50_05785, partial [Oscillospiraceae bacterium]|nr:hypothetical protein [Oscillospiraceae bacterium]
MFERLKKAVMGFMEQFGSKTGVAREYKDIFELGGVPAFNQFYNIGILVWKCLYKGFYAPWHTINAPTVANPKNKRNLMHMNLAKAISAELAGMIWTDQTEVSVSTDGLDAEQDPLEGFVRQVLD